MSESVKRNSSTPTPPPCTAAPDEARRQAEAAACYGTAPTVPVSGAHEPRDSVVKGGPAPAAGTTQGPTGVAHPPPPGVPLDGDTMAAAQAFANSVEALVDSFYEDVSGQYPVSSDTAVAALCRSALWISADNTNSFVDIQLMAARILSEANEVQKEDDEKAARVQKEELKRDIRRCAIKTGLAEHDTALRYIPGAHPAIDSSFSTYDAADELQRAKDEAVGGIQQLVDHRRAGEQGGLGSA